MQQSITKAIIKGIWPILWRNIFSLTAIIIGGLSITLLVLGDKRDGLFLATVITINIVVGIIQELRSRIALEKLQASAESSYKVLRDGKPLQLKKESILHGDVLVLSYGEQVPVDCTIVQTSGFECNEALLSGESDNITKKVGDKILAGSVVVAGSAHVQADKLSSESYLATMTTSLKKYSRSLSPIQRSLLKFIQIMAVSLAVIAIIMFLQTFWHEGSYVATLKELAAVAATIIAEGLILTTTLFFTYGAVRMARQKVLMQQINAIEKLGRITTVCIDKTGTLTQNDPVFEKLALYDKTHLEEKRLRSLLSAYTTQETSSTTTMESLRQEFRAKNTEKYNDFLPFSSDRKYAAARLKDNTIFVIGAAEHFVPQLTKKEQIWTNQHLKQFGSEAKRVLFVGCAESGDLDTISSLSKVRVLGLVVMSNPLKPASADTIRYLQKRGIKVIVISGDNERTVRAIADQVGLIHNKKNTSGTQVEHLTDAELTTSIQQGNLFSRILPSQKERIVRLAQKSGLVAMIGDGANDALAIKSADVGIAMFSGAPATRQIADVVLVNDSFAALPKGIVLSDTIITTLEMVASLFFSRVWTGLFLLLTTLLVGVDYPFTPRNITLLNILIVGLPVVLWGLWPRTRIRSIYDKSFLQRVLPFSITNAVIISIATLVAYFGAGVLFGIDTSQQQMIAYITFLITSIHTISITPEAMGAIKNRNQQIVIWVGFVFVAAGVAIVFHADTLAHFFGLQTATAPTAIYAILIGLVGGIAQVIAVKLQAGTKLYMLFHAKRKNAHTPEGA